MMFQLFNPTTPWLTAPAVCAIDRYLNKSMTRLEWGSGKSTFWFAERLRDLVSVEHNPDWYAHVAVGLERRRIDNVDYRQLSPDSDGNPYVSVAEEFPDKSFDFILVDGECRSDCLEVAVRKIKSGGLIVLDNADEGHFAEGLGAFEYRPTSNGVWRTDLFLKPVAGGGLAQPQQTDGRNA